MVEQPDQHTLAFLSRLPLLLAPLAPLSSAASHELSSLGPGAQSISAVTRCTVCRTELVGGLNASYWTERGELWANCGVCGATSSRARVAPSSGEQGTGFAAFERVKKRRRIDVRRRDEAVHPTALAATTAGKARVEPAQRQPHEAPARGAVVAVVTSAEAASSPSTRAPAPPDLRDPSSPPTSTAAVALAHPKPTHPPRSPVTARMRTTSATSSARATLVSSASTSPAPPTAKPASPGLAGTDAAAGKKRKRPKQPSGLAELLQAKKKREEAAQSNATGLASFLQGL